MRPRVRGFYSADRGDPRGDELLFNAAICFERGHSFGAAEQAFLQLVATHPNSKLAGKAIAHVAEIDGATGRFHEAAARLEEYVKKYTGERDAIDALENAVTYRLVLGEDAAAIADATYFSRTFGAKQPDRAAALMFRLVPTYEKSGGAIRSSINWSRPTAARSTTASGSSRPRSSPSSSGTRRARAARCA